MCRFKNLSILFLLVNFSLIVNAQSAEVKFEIPGKATFTYDGIRIQVGSSNTLLGEFVGQSITSGLDNTFLGKETGKKNSLGSSNTFLGALAGANNEGSGNVFIGYKAGLQEENVNDKLYISNSDTGKPLIYGDFRQEKVEINSNLDVNRDLYVDRGATINTELTVNGTTSLNSLNISSSVPSINFFAGAQGSFQFTFNPTQSRFFLTDQNNDEVLEIKNGDLVLPEYAGATGGNIEMDAAGKIIKTSANRTVYNQFEFHQKDDELGYTKLTRGVQFADGTVLSGIKALIMDNSSGNTGIGNTVFAGVYRQNKFSGSAFLPEPIYRIDASDTPTGLHEVFAEETLVIPGSNVIDNANYIYLIQVWYCDDCGVTEVEILE